jgi:hypothetical protein
MAELLICHPDPERSEAEGPVLCGEQQILRFAQDDKSHAMIFD